MKSVSTWRLLATSSTVALIACASEHAIAQCISCHTLTHGPIAAPLSPTPFQLQDTQLTGNLTNPSGALLAPGRVAPGAATSAAILLARTTLNGTVINAGSISASGAAPNQIGIAASNSTVTSSIAHPGGINNAGIVSVNAAHYASGIGILHGNFAGGIHNGGTILAQGGMSANGIGIGATFAGGITNTGRIAAVSTGSGAFAINLAGGSFSGGIANSGVITAASARSAIGIFMVTGTLAGGIVNSGTIAASGSADVIGVKLNGVVSGDLVNGGVITAVSTARTAIGVKLNNGAFSGAINNTGTIIATGAPRYAIAIQSFEPVSGGITNTGTISSSSVAINITPETGGSTTITQLGGAISGTIFLSANADQLLIRGGTVDGSIIGAPGNHDTVTITGGTLVLHPAPGQGPLIAADTVNLGGALRVAPQAGFFADTTSLGIVTAGTPITGNFTSLSSTSPLLLPALTISGTAATLTLTRVPFTAVPAASANGSAATIGLEAAFAARSPVVDPLFALGTAQLQTAEIALSGQDLTQILRFGLDVPRPLINAIEDRLTVDGAKDPAPGDTSGGVWARGYGIFGTAPDRSGGAGFDERREGIIAGADGRITDTLTLGGALDYGHDAVTFTDRSALTQDSYEIALYAEWRPGQAYLTGVTAAAFNQDDTTRALGIAGLPPSATGSFTGETYTAHGEAGYAFALPGLDLTPFAGIDVTRAMIAGATESGGDGADLTVHSSSSDSVATSLGVRATTRLRWSDRTAFVPELRAGWQHEFLDAAQSLSVAFAAAPNGVFRITGSNFGRDSALLGAGLTAEIGSSTRLYLDYDGRFNSGFNQHAISGGLRIRF